MKVIDLLNKIANGEELPKKFEYNDKIWRLASNRAYFIGSDYGYDFWLEHGDDKFEDEPITLNDEVKILDDEDEKEDKEKKIPEKIPLNYADDRKPEEVYEYLRCSYNQLIDYLKSKGE